MSEAGHLPIVLIRGLRMTARSWDGDGWVEHSRAEKQFHYAFANTVSRAESDAAYDRLHIPAPGSWGWAYGLVADGKPGHQETWVIRANAKKYRNSTARTDTYEFPERSPFTGVEPGWEQVADYALDWSVRNART